MAKIGIYGGTFNPIHLGHLNIMTGFYEKLKLDKLLLIPACLPPHKEAHMLASGEDRLKMCSLATEDLVLNIEVSDIELKLASRSYTAVTLEKLRDIYPGDEFYLLMGEDMFLTVDKWYKPEIIFREAVICGAPRSDNGYGNLADKAQEISSVYEDFRYVVEKIPYIEDSSTKIRELAMQSNYEKIVSLVPVKVLEYIKERKLYVNGEV